MDFKIMKKLDWIYDSLPWYGQELESTQKIMDDNFWSYALRTTVRL